MPSLEDTAGAPVDVVPPDESAATAAFTAALNDTGPDDYAPPRRQPRAKADGDAKPRVSRQPKAEKSRTTAAAKPVAKLDDNARRAGVKGLAQIGAGLALMLGKATKKDAFTADAVTIASAADDIADACVETAQADPKFAAALDKVCAAGPYSALITVGISVMSQCARNHKPSLTIPGTVDPAQLLKAQNDAEEQAKVTADVPVAA
jgi:hypothetical protein